MARGICALPYTRLRDGAQTWIPVNIIGNLYMSNGMAAGNTLMEARSHFFEAFAVEYIQPWMQRFEALLHNISAFSSVARELAVYSSFQLGAMYTAPQLATLPRSAEHVLELMDAAEIDANQRV